MLGCQDIVRLLDDSLDGSLDPADAAELDAHLAGCEAKGGGGLHCDAAVLSNCVGRMPVRNEHTAMST